MSLERKREDDKVEWVTTLKRAITYMEDNMLHNIKVNDVAKEVNISEFYLQKGFQIMTGYSISEYIRNRRLYLAALDLVSTSDKIIDLADKYGYETPESFTKAFNRYHGFTPSYLRRTKIPIKPFLPIKISIVIQGGENMDYSIEKMNGFKVIGYSKWFDYETSYKEIPKFWQDVFCKKVQNLLEKPAPETLEEETIINCKIGEFGVCIDEGQEGKFRYMIAGTYTEGEIPEGMDVFELPDLEWAKFKCVGPTPGALQSVNTKVFQEWLPGNAEFDIAFPANVEWYSAEGNTSDIDYESAVWVPVKRKK